MVQPLEMPDGLDFPLELRACTVPLPIIAFLIPTYAAYTLCNLYLCCRVCM